MKKLLNSLLLILVLSGMAACSSDLDSLDDGNHRIKREKNKPMIKTVRMSFGGDFISESEEPLMRGDEVEIYAGINVWRTEKKEGAKEEKFAYGLFKKSSGIEIDLITGYKYRFEATILINDKDKLYYDNNGYLKPFEIDNDKDNASWPFTSKVDEFQYTYNINEENAKRTYLHQLSQGTAYVTNDEFLTHMPLSYPRVNRYYGTGSNFDPEEIQSIEIPMNYKCFGLKFEVLNLPSGYITIHDETKINGNKDKEDHEKLIFPSNFSMGLEDRDEKNYFKNEWECTYSMNNLLTENETVKLKFIWHKGGSAESSFTANVTLKQGIRKIIKIDVSGSPNYSQNGNLTLKMLEDDLTDEKVIFKYDADNNQATSEKIE